MVEDAIKRKKGMMNGNCQCKCETPIKHNVCKEDYSCNPYICFCECDKDYEIGEYC